MTIRDCLDDVRRAFGGALSDDEVLELLEEFDSVARSTAEQRPWANVQEELFGHAQRLAKESREALLIERRNKMLNARIERANLAFLDQFKGADAYKAVIARDIGLLGFKEGGKASVAARSTALARLWMGSLINAFDKADLRIVMQRGRMDLPIARELWELGRVKGGKPGISGSKEAQAAAKVIHRLQEAMVGRLNRAGAFIKRMPGYIVRQTHDPGLIRRAGFNAWFAEASQHVDEFRTFGRFLADDERIDVYRKLWADLAAGDHLKPITDEDLMAAAPFKGAANLARRRSAHRAVHFTSAEAWHAYNRRFGGRSLMELLGASIVDNARDVALMETFGTNPERMHAGFVRKVDERLKLEGRKPSGERIVLPPEILYQAISGGMSRTANARLSQWAVFARATQVWSKLGSVLVSALGDTPIMAGELGRHGAGLLSRYVRPLGNLLDRVADDGSRQRLANMLGAYSEGVSGDLFGRFDMGDGWRVPGTVAKMNRLFWKLNGAQLWTDAHRSGVVRAFSAAMASRLDTAFDRLSADYRQLLGAYGIDAADWVRLKGAVETVDGVSFVLPGKLALAGPLDDAAGRRSARRDRDELATKLATFFSDRMDAAVLNPGARERAILLRGTQAGTVEGEFLRAVAQFKSFPAAVLSRVWGEHLGNSDYAGFAAVMIGLWVMGGVQTMMRDALRGIAPPDFSDPTAAGQYAMRAFLQGGGAGIMGDFFLGEHNRYGRTMIATMSGPLFGQIDSAAEIYAAIVRGEDAGAKSFRAIWTNLPFVNLYFARTALDYFLVYHIQELLNPGYLARMERRREKDTGQRFILSPSVVVGR